MSHPERLRTASRKNRKLPSAATNVGLLTSLRAVHARVRRLLESLRQVAENLVASFQRRTSVRDQDGNAVGPGRTPQIGAILSTGGNLLRDTLLGRESTSLMTRQHG